MPLYAIIVIPWLLHRDDRLLKVNIAVLYGKKFLDSENPMLNPLTPKYD